MITPTVNLRNVMALLVSRWLLLATLTFIAALAAAAYALTRVPQFESNALLAPVKEEVGQVGSALGGLLGQVAGVAGGLGLSLGGTTVDESVAVLQSREFALRFMAEHNIEQYLFPDLWDATNHRWKPVAGHGSPSMVQRLTRWLAPASADAAALTPVGPSNDDAVKRFNDILLVIIDRRTEFIRLSMRGPSAQVARDWAAAAIDELNASMRNRSLEESRKAVDLLSKRIESEQLQSIRTVAAALLETQLRREVMAESRREFAVKVLDPPSLPDQRFYPRRGRMVLIGALLGWMLGAIYVVLSAAWRQRASRPARRSARDTP